MRISRKLALLLLPSMLIGCGAAIFKHKPGATYGEIFVGPPRVTGRERLVNDRLVEDLWLKEQLDNSDSKAFGFSGFADLRSSSRRSFSANLQADPTQLNAYLDSAAAQRERAEQDRELNKAVFDNRKAMLLKDREKIEQGAQPTYFQDPRAAVTASAQIGATPVGPGTNAVTAPGLVNPAELAQALSQTDPREEFRDRQSLREVIRDERLRNLLDDKHDIRGNTLYRFGFDASILPQSDTSAWAVVEVTVSGTKNEKAETMGHQRRLEELLKNQMNKDILRLFSLGVGPGSCLESKDGQGKSKSGGTFCTDRLRDQIKIDMIRLAEVALFADAEKVNCGNKTPFESFSTRLRSADRDFGGGPSTRSRILSDNLEAYVDALSRCASSGSPSNDKEIQAQQRHETYRKLVAEYVTDSYRQQFEMEPTLATNKMLVSSVDATQALARVVTTSREVYAYAVTPKETVQRISEVASRRVATDIALGITARAGNALAGNLFGGLANDSQGLFDAIKRQPLVFGYNHAKSASQSSTFGWILGPRYSIADDGRSAHFRHTGVQHSVAAYVALPGWWRSATVEVRTRWYHENEQWKPAGGETIEERTFDIELPGELSFLADGLRPFDTKVPVPDELLEPIAVRIGDPASIIISGRNLWRNTVVTLGGQRHDEIEVLPDMAGVIARWKKIETPFGQRPNERFEVPISIWTSDGHATLAKRAVIVDKQVVGGLEKGVRLSTLRLYPGAVATMIFSGSLEADRTIVASIHRIGASGEMETAALASGISISKGEGNQLTLTVPGDIKVLGEAAMVGIRVTASATAGVLPFTYAVQEKAVLYSKQESATPSIKLKASNTVIRRDERQIGLLTIKVPMFAGVAYPGLNGQRFDINVSLSVDQTLLLSGEKGLRIGEASACLTPGRSLSCTVKLSTFKKNAAIALDAIGDKSLKLTVTPKTLNGEFNQPIVKVLLDTERQIILNALKKLAGT